jgi:hypothetical protein
VFYVDGGFGDVDEGGGGGGGAVGVSAECVSLAEGDCESDVGNLGPNPILDIIPNRPPSIIACEEHYAP